MGATVGVQVCPGSVGAVVVGLPLGLCVLAGSEVGLTVGLNEVGLADGLTVVDAVVGVVVGFVVELMRVTARARNTNLVPA